MTDRHPLTDEICDQIQDSIHPCDPENMRTAYDRGRDDQLEEAQAFLDDFLEKFSWRYSWQATYEVRAFVNNFKSCMRPQGES